MTSPGILPGGASVFNRNFSVTELDPPIRSNVGVFGPHPGATPKWALNRGPRGAEKRETLARLFIDVTDNERVRLQQALPQELQNLASVLTNTGYIDFILTNATETLQEKTQIVDTLTDGYVAFYTGQEPPVFQYSGTVLNTYQDDQRVWLLQMYRSIIRGTRMANRNLICRLKYDSFIVSGYLESLNYGLLGMTDIAGSFTFNMRVKSMSVFTPVLVHPTILESAATAGVAFGNPSQVESDSTERAATVTASGPPTATNLPSVLSTGEDEVDPREDTVVLPQQNLEQNLEVIAAGSDASPTQDGLGGTTNVRGQLPPEDLEVVASGTRRLSPRPRGLTTSIRSALGI